MCGLPWLACVNRPRTPRSTWSRLTVLIQLVMTARYVAGPTPRLRATAPLWITPQCQTHLMASNDSDIYDRLRALEQLVKHLYKQTGVPLPDLAALATT